MPKFDFNKVAKQLLIKWIISFKASEPIWMVKTYIALKSVNNFKLSSS